MLVLTIRTDKPESEIGLFSGDQQLVYQSWQAHRQLGETIHLKLHELLQEQHKELENIQSIIVFQGPGSFTGLRIGMSVANALAYGLQCPIVATAGDNWIAQGIDRLQAGEDNTTAMPHYGAPVRITWQKR